MSKKVMTIKEFNENYTISVLTEAEVKAKLNNSNPQELSYGSVEMMHENINYIVYDKFGNEVLNSSATTDFNFLQDLEDLFNIIDLDL